MNELIEGTQKAFKKGWVQGAVTLILVITLCYAVVVDPANYKDLFAYAVTGTLGFYFGRETKTDGGI